MTSSSDVHDRNALPPGSRLGPWRVTGWLGRGGMGSVYEARSDEGVVAAIKVIAHDVAADPRFVARFRREADLASRIRHRNVVGCFGGGESLGRLWLALELLPRGSLADRLKKQGPLPASEVARLGAGIARALEALHASGILHRDLKPANVLLGSDGTAKVTDFGLARGGGTSALTRTGELLGTIEYMAPEASEGGAVVDARSDLYSLGCTLYCLLAGEPPFPGSGPSIITKHLRVKPEPITQRAPGTPTPLAAIVDALLAKDPAARGGAAADVARALESVAASGRTGVVRSGRLVMGASAAVLLAGGAVFARVPSPAPATRLVEGHPSVQPSSGAIGSATVAVPAWFERLPGELKRSIPAFIKPKGAVDEYENTTDGSLLVYVPGGGFKMGKPPLPDEDASSDERRDDIPVHDVELSPYLLGKYEVTTAQFDKFVNQFRGGGNPYKTGIEAQKFLGVVFDQVLHPGARPSTPGASWRNPQGAGLVSPDDLPVVQVSWDDACAYAEWAGLRLPSEAEWELAASWTAEGPSIYPWGNESPKKNVNVLQLDTGAVPHVRATTAKSDDVSRLGAVDMGGNVSEWVVDLYDKGFYKTLEGRVEKDPCQLEVQARKVPHVYRGGNYTDPWHDRARCSYRGGNGTDADNKTGFRVAVSVGKPRPWEAKYREIVTAPRER